MNKPMKVVLLGAMIAAIMGLAACNTTKGVGKDIEKAGDSLKDSADKHGAD